MKKKVLGSNIDEIQEWFSLKNKKKFHAKQLLEWVYQKQETDISKMTNLSAETREELQSEFEVTSLVLVRMQESADNETIKFLWKLHDGKLVESVLICSFDRRTVCVSSQVGCPARCAFCASGKKGLVRDLSVDEIVSQVYQINLWLSKKGERVSHVVYMGMGEPMRNYDAVVRSIQLLIDPSLFNLSQRRITVSTVGVVEGIQRFAKEGLKVNLVLSLHAPNQKIREKIIPYARQYPLEVVLAAMWEYAEATHRDITFEYTLLSGINDSQEQAKELADLLEGKQCTVNLIPYNPVAGLRLVRPAKDTIKEFQRILEARGIVTTCRYTKGDDIAAACGQLVLHTEEATLELQI
jgi:23S rRNA (adenine2503-C2)-methyltransferase